MNKLYLGCLALGILSVPCTAKAADFVKFPDGPATWTVDVVPSTSNQDPAAAKQLHTLKLEVTQDGQRRRTVISYANGTARERWDIPGQNLMLAEDSHGQAFGAFGDGPPGYGIPFTPTAFQWLAPATLQEKDPIQYQGKMCFHYKGSINIAGPHVKHPENITEEAWIDSKTLLPVVLDNGIDLGTFTFSKIPPPPLTLPTKFQQTYDRFEGAMGVLHPVTLH